VEDIWHQQLFRFGLKKDLLWQALYMLIRHDLETPVLEPLDNSFDARLLSI